MKAVLYTEFGDTDVLQVQDVDAPHAGAGQIRLRVVSAGMNPVDVKIRHGWMADMASQLPATPGLEAAGIVDEVGEGVHGVAVGDAVLAPTVTGSYAEHAIADDWALKPAGLSWDTAAALPVGLETADRVLEELAVTAGETLVVHGASGIVGAFTAQLALRRGATVVGTASEKNHDFLRSLGVVPVAYGPGQAERISAVTPNGIDAIADITGRSVLELSIELLGGTKRLVTVSDPRAFELGVVFSGQNRRFGTSLARYAALVEAGELTVRVAAGFPLAAVHEASALVETGRSDGKVLLHP